MMIVSHSVFKEQKKHQRIFPPAVTGLSRWSGEQLTLIVSVGQPHFLFYFSEQFLIQTHSLCSSFCFEQGGSSYAHQFVLQPVF